MTYPLNLTPSLILAHLSLVVGFLLAVLCVAHILRQRRSPSATIAWLLAIVLIPYLGLPLYLLLGGRKMRRIAGGKTNLVLPPGEACPLEQAAPIDRLLRTYGIPGATAGNRFTLRPSGEEVYRCLMELIEEAAQSLWMTTFILHPDKVGKEVVSRLAAKANEGVDVRLLLDGVGSMHTSWSALAPLTEAGGQVQFFMPVFRRPFRGRTNWRNHRKMVIADQRRVLAGGANIADEYLGPLPDPDRWRDLSFTLQGPAVAMYEEIFRSDWEFASEEKIELPAPPPAEHQAADAIVQVAPSGPDVVGDTLYDTILSAAFAAQRRLWVATPYFLPDEALVRAVILAAHRGVDVRIIVPRRSNHPLADLARGAYLREIQAAGGTILRFTATMLHAKALLMDDELAMIGSANMDMRSLLLNYESALIVYSRREVEATAQWFESLAKNASVGVKPKVSMLRDLCEGVVRMIAPQL